MTIIDCVGSGRPRGLIHGEEARDRVREALGRWEEVTLSAAREGSTIETYVARFLSTTGLIPTLGRLLPDLLEEIRGIADGAGVAYETVAAYNLMDEQWWYDLKLPPQGEPGCSVVSVVHDSGTLLAQNMDLPAFMDGSQLILRIRAPDEPEALVLTSAGLVGLVGVNRSGVAVCVNTLLMLNHDPNGLPVAAVVRGALAQDTAEGAIQFLKSVPHASGQHYAIAGRGGVTGLECSALGAATSSAEGRRSLIHTNHPLSSEDIAPSALALLEERGRVADSRRRLAFLRQKIDSVAQPTDAIRILEDRTAPICLVPGGRGASITFGSVLFEVADMPRAAFCLKNPKEGRWVDVAWHDEPGAGSAGTRQDHALKVG